MAQDQPSASSCPPVPRSAPLAWRWCLVVGGMACLPVLATLNGPGPTVDEPLDVLPGRDYLRKLDQVGVVGFLRSEVIDATYRFNKEHPPLGRWLLGIAATLFEPWEETIRGDDPTGLNLRAARVAPALAFGLLCAVMARVGSRVGGVWAGLGAVVLTVTMPRVWSHAHLAALDTFITVFWLLALFSLDAATRSRRPLVGCLGAGLVFGLALLTKIHAWLLPAIGLVWAILRLGPIQGAIGAGLWGAVGFAVFLAGWPWLWNDPVGRLGAYLSTGVERMSIQTLYFGAVYPDRQVPWHYPWVHVLFTTPPIALMLAGWGAAAVWAGSGPRDPSIRLWIGAALAVLLVFSTHVPVYDGERLYLMVFPLLGLLGGVGLARLAAAAPAGRIARLFWWGGVMASIGLNSLEVVRTAPYGLSYYNIFIGGVVGAEARGMELSYWSEGFDDRLLGELARRVEPGQTVAVAPTLAPGFGRVLTTPALAAREVIPKDQEFVSQADWVLIHRRPVYWTQEVRDLVASTPPVAASRVEGVWIAGLWRRPNPAGRNGRGD